MWLLGAGASNAAGLPTADDLVVEFKRLLYVSQTGRTMQPGDLAEPSNRNRIEAHADSLKLPISGSEDEYASYFEAAFPEEADRSKFIEKQLIGAKPSYGHIALAALMSSGLCRLVWTTNFDTLIADACATVFGTTGNLTTATLDAPELARHSIAEERWPLEVKLHGDFRSHRLKNTGDELRNQDVNMRRMLVDCSKRFGLIVAGYSGRDESVMSTLEESLSKSTPFPSGIFWLQRGGDSVSPRVEELLNQAAEASVDAVLVEIENFDEILRAIVNLCNQVDQEQLSKLTIDRRYWSQAPRAPGSGAWPVVRLNALQLVTPKYCRRVECEIGGTAEVKAAVDANGLPVIAIRSRAGVLAFGDDEEIRQTFDSFGVTSFDQHTVNAKSPSERGLLHDTLRAALIRGGDLAPIEDNRRALVPAQPQDPSWSGLCELVGTLGGNLGKDGEIKWYEGITTRLEWIDDQLWFVFNPGVVFEGVTDTNRGVVADFARERSARRYNSFLSRLFDFWSHYLGSARVESNFNPTEVGIDAAFQIGSATAFSRRVAL